MNPVPPQPIQRVMPTYPESDRQQRLQGSVVYEVTFGTDGAIRVGRLAVRATPDMEKSARDAMQQWRLAPATCNGVPVEIETFFITTFTLAR
jgi:TonB family protein